MFAWRRAVRNGSVWLEHSLSFRGRQRLFLPAERWQVEAPRHYARLSLPTQASEFLAPLLERVRTGVDALAAAARDGTLRVDDELHLAPLAAEEESPKVETLRAQLDHRIGEVQLPEAILAVDAQVHFSWIMLGREPRCVAELLMTYAGILAHGTSLTAAECARMIPELSANSVRQAMRWAADERRLRSACQAILEYMQSHPIAASWGRADLGSSDMMSVETSKRVWQARLDPRRQTASVGVYSHVRDRWGIFHAQPIVLNERQAGAALEGVVRQERLETTQLAVDTHGYTDFAMALAPPARVRSLPALARTRSTPVVSAARCHGSHGARARLFASGRHDGDRGSLGLAGAPRGLRDVGPRQCKCASACTCRGEPRCHTPSVHRRAQYLRARRTTMSQCGAE